MEWLKEWAVPLSAGATFLLAIAAFWAIWQNYSLRKRDRKRRLKEQALIIVRNWVHDAVRLISLNAQYSDEHQRPEFNYGKPTLEKIQVLKDTILRESEETLISAQLWPELLTLVVKSYKTLTEFIEKGWAENPNLTQQYRRSYGKKFLRILPLTRQIEEKDPDFKI
jgi:hypothetical protein